jgi:hypothetical protein
MFQRHLTTDLLADLAAGRLADSERIDALNHLASCARCTGELAWIERASSTLHASLVELEDAPDALVTRAVSIFRPAPQQATTEASPGIFQRIVASLTFDSGSSPLAFGVRSALPVERQLLASADAIGIDIDLRVVPHGDRWNVIGQMLGDDESFDGTVTLQPVSGDTAVRTAPINQFGEFTVHDLPSGMWELVASQPGRNAELVLSELRIGT